MKKFLFLLLSTILVFCCSCSSGSNSTAVAEQTSNVTSIKVGGIFLHDENSNYDNNFIAAFKEACEKANVEYIMKTNIPETNECFETCEDLVDAGCNIIFADSFSHEDYVIESAKLHPDVQYCHATGTKAHTLGLDNYHNAFASIYEGRYVAGVAAGLKLNELLQNGTITEAKLGYVGAYTYAEVISGYTSFFLGAQSVCPEATMEVIFTGTWYDQTLESEAAQKLIADGCAVISQHADSMGAPAVCEENGIPNVSYNGSTVKACPNTFIVSTKINWEPYFELIIDSLKHGTDIPTDFTGTFDTDSILMTEVNEAAAAPGTAEVLNETIEKLKSGEIKVFDTSKFTVDGYHIDSYLADVDYDADYVHDTEVVVDGVFLESLYRSAPYFDINIDGITLLNSKY